MADYFDPRSWSPLARSFQARSAQAWSPLRAVELGKRLLDPVRLGQWSARTGAWLDPVADLGAGTVTALLPDVLMSLLREGILDRFAGREIGATLRGQHLTALLESLEIVRRGAHFRADTVLSGLRWNGYPIEEMTIVAHGVRLIPGVPVKVRAGTLDITATVTTAALANWLNRSHPTWELGIGTDGLITARHRRIRAVLDGVVADNVVTIVVHRAYWRGIPIPRRRLAVNPIVLSELPNRMRVLRADRDGDVVRFHLDIPEVTGSFDLAQIRAAIMTGTTLIVF